MTEDEQRIWRLEWEMGLNEFHIAKLEAELEQIRKEMRDE